ncbi:MAG: CoA transferase [Gammaproteobacteria bacterium]|nr:CoA transferase [Gammaproteobacteria bacterium]
MTSAFNGLRVVDLSDRLSGAFAARLFGDFGADVILAEPPEGHPLRSEEPFLDNRPGIERSVAHAYVNWNKRSVVIDGPDALDDLVAAADVVVTTHDAPAFPLSPDAVHLSVTPHGLEHPLARRPGNNLTASARVGWSFINGYRGEPPLRMPLDQAGMIGGVTGFIAAAAALRRRTALPAAERVDVSELEAFALTVHPWGVAAVYDIQGTTVGPVGGRPRGRSGPLWDLADGRMSFALGDFRNWTRAMDVMDLPEFGRREELVPDMGRHSQDLRGVRQAMTRTLPELERWPVFHALAKLRCVIGVMQDIDDIVSNEQLIARDFIVETRIEDKAVRAPGPPARLSPDPWQLRRPAPRLGAHKDEIKQETAAASSSAEINVDADPLHANAACADAGPLSGTRVLSFSQAWSGAFATELLALLGADVVQVASLDRPDVFRRVHNRVPRGVVNSERVQHPLNTQGLYNSVNLHKREVTIDLKHPRGMEMLWKLMPRFDILVDNFRPAVMPSWGITLEKLHDLRPGMIWASVSAYGENGPYREYPGNGTTTEPMAGFSSVHGYDGDAGTNSGGLYPDPVAGYFLVATIMAALRQRDRTGEAQRVDLSMMEAVAVVCGEATLEYDAAGVLPRPQGNHHRRISPHNHYRTGDGRWLALAAETDAAWDALAAHIADPRLQDLRFSTMALRKENETELDALIGEWCKTREADEAERSLGALGIAAARVVPLYELYSRPDPNFLASGFISEIDHPETGRTWLPGRPWRFSAGPQTPIRPAPCVGQHSREVLAEELGLNDMEYNALVIAGITGTLDDIRSR